MLLFLVIYWINRSTRSTRFMLRNVQFSVYSRPSHSYFAWSLRLVTKGWFISFCVSLDSLKTIQSAPFGFGVCGCKTQGPCLVQCSLPVKLRFSSNNYYWWCPGLAWADPASWIRCKFGGYLFQLLDELLIFIFWQEQPSHFWTHRFLNPPLACCLGQKALGKFTKEIKYFSCLWS